MCRDVRLCVSPSSTCVCPRLHLYSTLRKSTSVYRPTSHYYFLLYLFSDRPTCFLFGSYHSSVLLWLRECTFILRRMFVIAAAVGAPMPVEEVACTSYNVTVMSAIEPASHSVELKGQIYVLACAIH